nr:endonuclease [Autographiviridae sp.]
MKRYFSRRGGWSKHVDATYRSGLEDKVAEQLRDAEVDAKYEEYQIPYSIPATNHTYTPDFVLPNGIIVETKGVFEVEDRKKHLLVKSQYPNLDIRFVFSSSKTPIYKGSKTTYATWCNKYGFKYADKWIPDKWLRERKKDTKGLVKKKKKGG